MSDQLNLTQQPVAQLAMRRILEIKLKIGTNLFQDEIIPAKSFIGILSSRHWRNYLKPAIREILDPRNMYVAVRVR